jgi:hypothetical protein
LSYDCRMLSSSARPCMRPPLPTRCVCARAAAGPRAPAARPRACGPPVPTRCACARCGRSPAARPRMRPSGPVTRRPPALALSCGPPLVRARGPQPVIGRRMRRRPKSRSQRHAAAAGPSPRPPALACALRVRSRSGTHPRLSRPGACGPTLRHHPVHAPAHRDRRSGRSPGPPAALAQCGAGVPAVRARAPRPVPDHPPSHAALRSRPGTPSQACAAAAACLRVRPAAAGGPGPTSSRFKNPLQSYGRVVLLNETLFSRKYYFIGNVLLIKSNSSPDRFFYF